MGQSPRILRDWGMRPYQGCATSSAEICQETGERDVSRPRMGGRVFESERFRLGGWEGQIYRTPMCHKTGCKVACSASVRTCKVPSVCDNWNRARIIRSQRSMITGRMCDHGEWTTPPREERDHVVAKPWVDAVVRDARAQKVKPCGEYCTNWSSRIQKRCLGWFKFPLLSERYCATIVWAGSCSRKSIAWGPSSHGGLDRLWGWAKRDKINNPLQIALLNLIPALVEKRPTARFNLIPDDQ